MKTLNERALEMHAMHHGKLETTPKVDVDTKEALSLAYSPGVAEPCRRIAEDKELSYDYTLRANTVAVVSDGSAVLGLGNIGPEAALPVMEGKAVLFKSFAGSMRSPSVSTRITSTRSSGRSNCLRRRSVPLT